MAGHMVSGAFVYDVLQKESPETLAKVVALLKKHPEFDRAFAEKLAAVPAEVRDKYLLMLAARWPDDARGNKKYDHPTWHYINYPFKPAGQPDSVRAPDPPKDNILQGFEVNLKKLQHGGQEEQAIALCWLFHLVGDVHQPLHTTALFTTDYPEGDKGGNLVFIRVEADGKPINLHFFWDGLLLGSMRFQDARNVATKLRARPEFARDKLAELKETAFEKWARTEGFELARHAVYLNGKLRGSTTPEVAPVLPEGYTKKAKALAERRMALAGYRLADFLKKTVP
jgi:hypothetical protein